MHNIYPCLLIGVPVPQHNRTIQRTRGHLFLRGVEVEACNRILVSLEIVNQFRVLHFLFLSALFSSEASKLSLVVLQITRVNPLSSRTIGSLHTLCLKISTDLSLIFVFLNNTSWYYIYHPYHLLYRYENILSHRFIFLFCPAINSNS